VGVVLHETCINIDGGGGITYFLVNYLFNIVRGICGLCGPKRPQKREKKKKKKGKLQNGVGARRESMVPTDECTPRVEGDESW
jgi:hypothetical protein